MLKLIGILALPLVVAALAMSGIAVGDETAPAVLAAGCVTCHSPKVSDNAIPPLTGLEADQIREMMLGFRSGEIEATIMNRIAAGYTDAEIEALAAEVAGWNAEGEAQ